ncbi:MAG TPA: hypothetical protein VLT33_10780 [Labilithrix sp.]|nr:hypothetical protein [Labilithrix sp.]
MPIILTREMFSISVDGARGEIRIWRRPELDSATGARNASELAEEGAKLPTRGVREVVVDLRAAPGIAGPKTTASMGAMFGQWAAAKVRIAVLISDDPLMALQYRRLVTEHAPKSACVTTSPAEIDRWFAASG